MFPFHLNIPLKSAQRNSKGKKHISISAANQKCSIKTVNRPFAKSANNTKITINRIISSMIISLYKTFHKSILPFGVLGAYVSIDLWMHQSNS